MARIAGRLSGTLLVSLALLSSCDVPYSEPKTPADFFERAVSAYQDDHLSTARDYFLKAETLSIEQDRVELTLQAIVYQVRIAYELGELHTAIQKAEEGAVLARKIGDFRAEAEVRTLEGRSYRVAGLLKEANRALEDALRISETFEERPKVIEAELALGKLWLASADPGMSADYFSKALEGAQGIKQDALAARALNGLAAVFLRQKKDQEARNSMLRALELLKGGDEPLLLAKTRLLQGEILEREGNANAALSAYRDAVNGLRRARTGRRLEVLCLFRIGMLYQKHRRSGDAKKYFSDGLEIARREGDKIAQYYLNIHLLLADIRMMPPSQQTRIAPRIVQAYSQLAAQFASILQSPGEALVRGMAGEILRRAGSADALEYLTEAAEAERSLNVSYIDPILHRPYVTALQPASDEGQWSRAAAGELLRNDSLFAALTTLEQYRLDRYADNLEGSDMRLRHPEAATEADSVRNAYADLRLQGIEISAHAGLTRPGDDLPAEIIRFKSEEKALISRANGVSGMHQNYAVVVRTDSLDLAGIRRYIPRGVTMIEHIGDGPVIHIVALSRTDMIIRTVAVPETTVHAQAEEYVRLMLDPMVYSGEGGESSVPGMTRFATLSTGLYDMLIRPVESVIDRGMIVVPNDMIGALPIHALERQEGDRLEFVIERMGVDYLPSWTSVMFPTRSPGRMRTIVAFGNPSGKNWSVDYELRDIRSFFRNADVYTGRDASWENMSRTKPDLLQVSSEFLPGLSPFGVFVVSEGEVTEETRNVPFEQLVGLEPSPVILLTNQVGGQYGLGPQHAMLLRMNGTSDIFLNRWIADRKAAKFFSEYFFTHLSGGLAPGDAYRQALLNLIQTREHAHPRSWAQFFHFGTG